MSIDINKLRSKILESKATEVLVFQPSREQMLAKANFWTVILSEKIELPLPLELASALKYGAYKGISDWWDKPGFSEWFTNQDEFRQKLEFLSNIALDHLEKLLYDEKANANAKVAAIKLIMEMGKKMPSKSSEEQYVDEKIQQMDRSELEKFIQAKLLLVPTGTESK